MNILEKYFDTAFAAPDGIKKLRELILTLAMHGKLVPQNPGDAPASLLLKEIDAEKARLVKAGKIKAPKPLPPIKPEEIPYLLPKGWEWVRLGQIILFTNGYSFKSNLFQKKGIGIVKIGDISDGLIVKDRMDFIDESYFEEIEQKFQVRFGDMLIAMSGATTGKLGFNKLKEVFLLNQRVGKIEPIILDKTYLFHFLSTQIQKNLAISSGSAIPNLSTEQINETVIPLPPLLEQRRIVEKVDQLMARCDALEKLRAERDEKHLVVHAAALNRLMDSKSDESFAGAWAFIHRHFSDLYSVTENVADLRKAILQLAVMGKLVPQNPGDAPASLLLKEIEAEKARLVKAGKIKAQNPLPPIKPEEIPYQLPKGWEWVRLGGLIELISGQHLTPDEYNEDKVGFSYYTGPADFGDKSPRATRWTTVDRAIAIREDILLTVKGAGVGKTNVVEEEKAAISRQLMALRVVKIDRFFVLYFLSSIFSELQSLAVGIAIPGIGREDVLQRKFPLPPLAEQRRIVAKIDQLMALCDLLEQHIEAATQKQTDLLSAVMAF
ncbi:MAG: restriction endonuclease subunit S [Chlorobiales bacterium]|nr:restriction endonuclease subunit S [Chlorobiales bacterium]